MVTSNCCQSNAHSTAFGKPATCYGQIDQQLMYVMLMIAFPGIGNGQSTQALLRAMVSSS